MSIYSVFFVAPSAYPMGGVQTWLDYLSDGLRSRGWRVTVGLTSGLHHDVGRYIAEHPGIDFRVIANPTGSLAGRINSLVTSIQAARADVVVMVNIADCFLAIEKMRFQGAVCPRLVVAAHSLDPEYLQDAKRWRHVIDGFVGVNRLILGLASQFSALSSARVHYAPCGVSLAKKALNEDLGADAILRIAYVGRVERDQKRTQDLKQVVEALDRLGVAFELRIAGGGPDLGDLRLALDERSRGGQVQFLGTLDVAALELRVYGWADALLVTSSWETGPIVIWEAFSHGVAVVSTRFLGSGLEAVLVHDQNALLFEVGDTENAALQLSRLTDRRILEKLVLRGREVVEESYTVERSVRAWDCALRSTIASDPLPTPQCVASISSSGRLDGLFGPRLGEWVRRASKRGHRHTSAGGEWPHVHHGVNPDERREFYALAHRLDAGTV